MFVRSGLHHGSICSVACLVKRLLCPNLGQYQSGCKALLPLRCSLSTHLSQKKYYNKMISHPHNHRPSSSSSSGTNARRGGQAGRRDRGGHRFQRHGDNLNNTTHSTVPRKQLVVPDAAVSIVLKEDQATGRQVQGNVKDVLTRGDHPRGIKVRLSDGRIGRVQRMICAVETIEGYYPPENMIMEDSSVPGMPLNTASRTQPGAVTGGSSHFASTLPPRALADYMPQIDINDETPQHSAANELTSTTAVCPICSFEGDEAAVSHHVGSHFG